MGGVIKECLHAGQIKVSGGSSSVGQICGLAATNVINSSIGLNGHILNCYGKTGSGNLVGSTAAVPSTGGLLTDAQMKDFCDKFEQAIGTVEEVLKMDDYIKGISEKIKDTFSAFYLGRGLDYGIACEACLKLKEISYVNAEAYCAGELKHGTISLITEGVPVIAIATQENVLPKLMANVEEVKARGAHVIVVTDKDMSNYEGIYDDLIQVPATDDLFATFASTVALQLLAYHVTVFRGYDVDQPRNLAKSVTVE